MNSKLITFAGRMIPAFAFVLLFMVPTCAAQDASQETLLDNLNNPSGVAIQPGTGHVFVADSGALRIIRLVDGKAEEVITGFPRDTYGKGPLYDIGPLSLIFLDQTTLVVGGGGLADGQDLIRMFDVPATGQPAIKADQVIGKSMSLPEKDGVVGEGNFYGMVATGRGIYVTCNGDDKKGWISLVTFAEGSMADMTRSIPLVEKTQVTAPTAITFSPDGYLAIGQMGPITTNKDSLLTFCDPEDGEVLASFKTGMYDVTGLAYGPRRGRLFATDFKWHDTSKGALVKLVGSTGGGCEAREVLPLEKPTALAFAQNGDCYVTLAGNTSEGSEPNGKLILIKGLDDEPGSK